MNRRAVTLAIVVAVLFALSFGVRTLLRSFHVETKTSEIKSNDSKGERRSDEARYERIVSLAPSITEILFALGLGDRVVGVTRYCDYPEAAKTKSKVGGFYDPNNEAIVALQPDLVILYGEHETTRQVLKGAQIEYLELPHYSISDILTSINAIGTRMGDGSRAEKNARELVANLRHQLAQFKKVRPKGPVKTVMISTGRNMGTGKIEDAFIVGKEGFYQEMIEILGAQNAYDGPVAFPIVSNEGIMQMNPDVIIDMVPDLDEKVMSKTDIQNEWLQLEKVTAVKKKQVHILTEDYVVIPGPRFILLMKQMDIILRQSVAGSLQ